MSVEPGTNIPIGTDPQAQQSVEIWRCNHCGYIVNKEDEVICWNCGKGEMIFQGHNWIPAVPLQLPWWDRVLWRIFGKHWVRFIEWWDFR